MENVINLATNAMKKKESSKSLLLGKYELGKLLGHGTFAKVYYARNASTNQSVAIKIIDKAKILKGGLTTHIKREIAILRKVRHPNIVQLFEVMATKTKIYFVMEYVRGGDLLDKLSKGRLTGDIARKYFQQLISAVNFCHNRGVYHRDLKPENILLDENGDLKVSDFGLGCVADETRNDSLFHTFCGTPAYIAPEVLARKGYDPAKADIWSCGVILFILMSGYLPFREDNIMAMYKKILKGEFRCPKWFSPRLTRFLSRFLDTNPQTRVTIPEIMTRKWFIKGFNHVEFNVDYVGLGSDSDQSLSENEPDSLMALERRDGSFAIVKPQSLNAFDIISFSRGFDLSGLFEDGEGGGDGLRFVTGSIPVTKIISKLEEIGEMVSFTVRKKDCRVSLEGCRQGAKGSLTIVAEIFELTPELRVVEVKKKGGDMSEYEELCNIQLRPALQTLISSEGN